MKNLKRLFAYALLFAGTFSLTALSCVDLSEEITVDVPTEINKTLRLATTETGAFNITEVVDIASAEFKEKREKMKNYTVESLTLTVVDNRPNGNASANPTGFRWRVETGNGASVSLETNAASLQEHLQVSVDNFNLIKELIETYILTPGVDSPTMNIIFIGNAASPMDYTINLNMKGKITATAD